MGVGGGVSRGVRDTAPYRLPGMGDRGEPAPHPALQGCTFPEGEGKGCMAAAGSRPLPRQLVLGAELEGQGCSTSGLTKPAQYPT